MRKIIISFFAISIILTVLIYGMIFMIGKSVVNSYNSYEDSVKIMVGDKVLLEKDTLSIIDYSLVNKTYELSNGSNISFDFAKKNKMK